jgi:putative SOS response-associated peptidase YedK
MCGRYSLVCIDDLGNRFRVFNPMIGARSKFNIAPGTRQPVIVQEAGGRTLPTMQWGLIPPWTKDIRSAKPIINARAETLAEKPSFKPLLKDQRCLVPASGFYEWKKEGTKKTPFYIHLPEHPLFSFAGLYDQWHGPEGAILSSYTIITCEPNDRLAAVHNRMPVILRPPDEDRWLSGTSSGSGDLNEILAPYPAEDMALYPVSPLVNTLSNDNERLVRPANSFTHAQTQFRE